MKWEIGLEIFGKKLSCATWRCCNMSDEEERADVTSESCSPQTTGVQSLML